MSIKKIKTLSHQSGHSWITVRRAKEQLGIIHKKEPFGGDWIWRLLTKENQLAQVGDQVAHTQKDELFEHFEQHGDNLTNSVQLINNSNQFSIKTEHVAQKAQSAQSAQRNHMGGIEQHDEQHELDKLLPNSSYNELYKQNLNNIEQVEDIFSPDRDKESTNA